MMILYCHTYIHTYIHIYIYIYISQGPEGIPRTFQKIFDTPQEWTAKGFGAVLALWREKLPVQHLEH